MEVEATTTTAAAAAATTEAPAPLTGSAAMLAKMRKSSALTGEKRATAARGASASARDGVDATATKAKATRTFVLHGGEAAAQIAKDLGARTEGRSWGRRCRKTR